MSTDWIGAAGAGAGVRVPRARGTCGAAAPDHAGTAPSAPHDPTTLSRAVLHGTLMHPALSSLLPSLACSPILLAVHVHGSSLSEFPVAGINFNHKGSRFGSERSLGSLGALTSPHAQEHARKRARTHAQQHAQKHVYVVRARTRARTHAHRSLLWRRVCPLSTLPHESRLAQRWGFMLAETLVQIRPTGGNGTAGRTLHQLLLDFW